MSRITTAMLGGSRSSRAEELPLPGQPRDWPARHVGAACADTIAHNSARPQEVLAAGLSARLLALAVCGRRRGR